MKNAPGIHERAGPWAIALYLPFLKPWGVAYQHKLLRLISAHELHIVHGECPEIKFNHSEMI